MKYSKNNISHPREEKTTQIQKMYKPNSLIIGIITGKMPATCFLVIAFLVYFFTLMIEVICSSKTSGFVQTTWHYNPEDYTLQHETQPCKNVGVFSILGLFSGLPKQGSNRR
jgi:hypothetical protein